MATLIKTDWTAVATKTIFEPTTEAFPTTSATNFNAATSTEHITVTASVPAATQAVHITPSLLGSTVTSTSDSSLSTSSMTTLSTSLSPSTLSTPTPSTSPSSDLPDNSTSVDLSKGTVGAIVGTVLPLVFITVIFCLLWRRYDRKRKPKFQPQGTELGVPASKTTTAMSSEIPTSTFSQRPYDPFGVRRLRTPALVTGFSQRPYNPFMAGEESEILNPGSGTSKRPYTPQPDDDDHHQPTPLLPLAIYDPTNNRSARHVYSPPSTLDSRSSRNASNEIPLPAPLRPPLRPQMSQASLNPDPSPVTFGARVRGRRPTLLPNANLNTPSQTERNLTDDGFEDVTSKTGAAAELARAGRTRPSRSTYAQP